MKTSEHIRGWVFHEAAKAAGVSLDDFCAGRMLPQQDAAAHDRLHQIARTFSGDERVLPAI